MKISKPVKIGVFAALAVVALALTTPAAAQSINVDVGNDSLSGRAIQTLLLLTVLSLAPGILMTVTSFTRIVVVLSLMRNGMGTQGAPPNAVLISLAMFLSFFVMGPTFDKAWDTGIGPMTRGEITEKVGLERATVPFKEFMLKHTREKDLALFIELSGKKPASAIQTPLTTIAPAFLISELKRAFEIGFLVILPFIIIDLVVSSVLMSMGMMMLPPVMISLPVKLIFFVLVDGWYLIAGALVKSYG